MTTINRRTILGSIAATAGGVVATAIPFPAPAAVEEQPLSPEERLQAAIEELKAAATVTMPNVKQWRIYVDPERDGCPLVVSAFTF